MVLSSASIRQQNDVGTQSHQSALISNQDTDDPLDFRHAEQNLGYRNSG